MSYDSVADKIRSQFKADFEAAYPTTPWFAPNQSPDPTITELWVALDIVSGRSGRRDFADKKYRRFGQVQVTIFTPVNTGDNATNGMTDSIQSWYEGERFTDAESTEIVFFGTEVVPGGSTERFTETAVIHEFYYDDP